MPGAMHRMGVYLGLVEDDDYADGEGDAHDEAPERADGPRRDGQPRPVHPMARQVHASGRPSATGESRGEYAETASRTDTADGGYAEVDRPAYQITTLHPRTYNEARTIGEHFRQARR